MGYRPYSFVGLLGTTEEEMELLAFFFFPGSHLVNQTDILSSSVIHVGNLCAVARVRFFLIKAWQSQKN